MDAIIIERPSTFDSVARVKEAVGEPVLWGDDALWILGQDMVFTVDGKDRRVPAGFTTDGASIPPFAQVLTGWAPWEEPQRWGAIAHDYLYCVPGVAKSYADHVFRALLRSEGAGWYRRSVMFWAVSWFGGHAYRIDQAQGPLIYV